LSQTDLGLGVVHRNWSTRSNAVSEYWVNLLTMKPGHEFFPLGDSLLVSKSGRELFLVDDSRSGHEGRELFLVDDSLSGHELFLVDNRLLASKSGRRLLHGSLVAGSEVAAGSRQEREH